MVFRNSGPLKLRFYNLLNGTALTLYSFNGPWARFSAMSVGDLPAARAPYSTLPADATAWKDDLHAASIALMLTVSGLFGWTARQFQRLGLVTMSPQYYPLHPV